VFKVQERNHFQVSINIKCMAMGIVSASAVVLAVLGTIQAQKVEVKFFGTSQTSSFW